MNAPLLKACLDRHPGQPIDSSALMGAEHGVVRAAVVAIARPVSSDGLELLFIQRSERKGDPWSGHMAFPGGRVDPTDENERAAALRETREELGLDLEAHGCMLGRLDDVVTPVRLGKKRMVVTPYVAWVDGDPPLQCNHEVAGVYWFRLGRFTSGEGRSHLRWAVHGGTMILPTVTLDGKEIWGLTLRMVRDLLWRLPDGVGRMPGWERLAGS